MVFLLMEERGRKDEDPEEILASKKVKDFMDSKFETVSPKTPLTDLIKCLEGREDDFLLVANEKDKLIGVITEFDLLKILKFPRVGPLFARIDELQKHLADTVEELVTRKPVTVSKDASLKEAIDWMVSHRIRHIPVVEEGKPVGTLTLKNLYPVYRQVAEEF